MTNLEEPQASPAWKEEASLNDDCVRGASSVGIECMASDGDNPFKGKRREFHILVQVFDKENVLTKQATFADLKNATSYVEMRERIEGRRCLVWAIEHEPQIVGTMRFAVTSIREESAPTSCPQAEAKP